MAVLKRALTVLIVLTGAATVLGLLDRASWWFELASVFRLQYAVVLAAAALAAAALRRIRLAAIAAALAALNIAVIGPPFAPPATAATSHDAQGALRLLVVNVEAGNERFESVRRVIAQTKPDIVGVIELTPDWADYLRRSIPQYRMRRLAPRDGAYGIGLYSRLPLLAGRVEQFPPEDGPPTVVARVRAAGQPVTVVVTHVHTPFAGSIHARQLQALAEARPRLGRRLALCGDFNTVPWAGPFRRLAETARLADLYGGSWPGYSWPTWNPLLRVPLDNCLVSEGLAVTRRSNGPDVGSDHFPLVVDLAVTARP